MAGGEGKLHTYFSEDEAFALKQSVREGGWRRWWERKKSRGQPFLTDSSTMLRYLSLILRALERYQGFLARKDFLFTKVIQVVSQKKDETFRLESVFNMATWDVPLRPNLVFAQAESRVLQHLSLSLYLHLLHLYLSPANNSFNQSFHHWTSIYWALIKCQTLCRGQWRESSQCGSAGRFV